MKKPSRLDLSNHLLLTKFNIPPSRPELVARPHLTQKLNRGLHRKLILISAPAGYGKTTLVSAWIERLVGVTTCWLTLDEADNDPKRFAAYLAGTFQKVSPVISQSITPRIQSPQPVPPEAWMTDIINEIALFKNPVVLVLDDYHLIHTPEIHHAVSFLMDHQPQNFTIVVLTREDPLFPIARLRGRNQITEIDQKDLRFSTDETHEFLQNMLDEDISLEEILALAQRTEGWVAGLQLTALSLKKNQDRTAFIKDFTGSNHFILDFLITEVFSSQSLEVKDFLLKTSILDSFCDSLCDSVTGLQHTQAIIDSLDHANAFIISMDQSHAWYRYHQLFRDLLHHQLRISELDVKHLHQRASQWFEKHALHESAIHHAIAGEDWETAKRLLQDIYSDYLKRGEVITVNRWFSAFPKKILFADPLFCFDASWPLLLSSQIKEAEELLDFSEKAANGYPDFLGEVYAAQAYLARMKNHHQQMVEYSEKALKLLAETSLETRAIVAINLGIAYWHMGEMTAAEKVLQQALQAGTTTNNQYVVITAIIFLGRIQVVRGHLNKGMNFFRRAQREGHDMPINALAYMDIASVQTEWNQLEEAQENIDKSIELCYQGQNYEFLIGAMIVNATIKFAMRNFEEATKLLEQAHQVVIQHNVPETTAHRLDALQARFAIATQQPAEQYLESLTNTADYFSFYRFLGITKALVLPKEDAIPYLQELSHIATANDWKYGLIAVLILQAKLARTKEDALQFLEKALYHGKKEGFLRIFMDFGENLRSLLQEAVETGIYPDYAANILKAWSNLSTTNLRAQTNLVENLTGREVEVLNLLALGRSNREIAEQLFISTGTAKTHVHNICGKLGVNNRTQAAMKAKELHLLQ